jgi:hypothetical protein
MTPAGSRFGLRRLDGSGRLGRCLQSHVTHAGQGRSQRGEARRLESLSLAVGDIRASDVEPMVKAQKLRELATWYRGLAAQTANSVIWEARLLTAEDLDAEAERIEHATRPGSLAR